jgi:adenylate kinase
MVMATGRHENYRNQRQIRIILLMGAPGSGKGTQSALLASRFDCTELSTGAMLREEAKRNSPSGFRLRKIMASGAFVDDATVCRAVASRIRASQSDSPESTRSGDIFILDGFPRTVGQARSLDRLLEGLGMPAPLVLHLVVPNDVLMRRLARRRQCATCGAICNLASGLSIGATRCQVDGGARCPVDGGSLVERDDDAEGVVAQRLRAYETETLPVVEYYRKRDRCGDNYRRIDGNRGAAEIAKDLCDIVLFADTAVAA